MTTTIRNNKRMLWKLGLIMALLLVNMIDVASGVDCSGEALDTCEACVEKDGCGWAPELGECHDCQYASDFEYICWESKWWSGDACPPDHCFRIDTCAECLAEDDCLWWYSDLDCRPGDVCPLENVDCFSFQDDVADSDQEVTEFCEPLDDTTCIDRTICTSCVGDDKCGWLHREGAEGPVCLPASVCEDEINCYTEQDFGKVSENADADEFCTELIMKYKEEAKICAQAQGCRDCVSIVLPFFDRCKWFHRLESVEITLIHYDCGLECHDIESYDGCIEQPETCPCVPEASCEECLGDGCGYWAADYPDKYLWRYVPFPPFDEDLVPRCYHFCRNDDYEFRRSDENCFEFDESLGLAADELCADHEACGGIATCEECYATTLPSDSSKTCVWLRDSLCAPRCDTRGCDVWTCDPCDRDPCLNGGSCYSSGGTFQCECPFGFAGTTCGEVIEPPPLYIYNEYDGACRKDAEGTDKGKSDEDYTVYKTENYPNIDLDWCRAKCDEESDCTGVEFRQSGCEVWHSAINGFEAKDGHACLVRVDRAQHYVYDEYAGACRKHSDGSGKGTDGNEYDLFKTEDNPDINFQWCKRRCDESSDCSGFEYRASGCEIWHYEPINGFEEKDDHVCQVKADYYYDYSFGACRKHSDQTGKGSSGNEYELHMYKPFSWCMEQCSEDENCKGFEHRYWPDDNTQCELWTGAEINSIEPKEYLYCYQKRHRE